MNNVNLIGRLTSDPRIITTRTGKKVAHFSIAINGASSTVFVQITAWSPVCNTVESYVKKGQNVGISGRLSTSSNGGLEVIANAVHLIENRGTNQNVSDSYREDDDDLDFPD